LAHILVSSCFQLLKPTYEPYLFLGNVQFTGVEVVEWAGMSLWTRGATNSAVARTSIEAISSNLRPSIRRNTRYAHAPQRLPVSCAAWTAEWAIPHAGIAEVCRSASGTPLTACNDEVRAQGTGIPMNLFLAFCMTVR